ncbi:MAG: helix-turn-helix domain-containing protein [Myxococcales bacterium]
MEDRPVTARVGANARLVRLRQGRTQEEVAHEARLSLHHLQEIERGEIDIRISTLYRLALALKVDAGTFFHPAETARRKPGRPRSRTP